MATRLYVNNNWTTWDSYMNNSASSVAVTQVLQSATIQSYNAIKVGNICQLQMNITSTTDIPTNKNNDCILVKLGVTPKMVMFGEMTSTTSNGVNTAGYCWIDTNGNLHVTKGTNAVDSYGTLLSISFSCD